MNFYLHVRTCITVCFWLSIRRINKKDDNNCNQIKRNYALPLYIVSMHCTGHLFDEIVNSPPLAPQNTDPHPYVHSSSTLLEE